MKEHIGGRRFQTAVVQGRLRKLRIRLFQIIIDHLTICHFTSAFNATNSFNLLHINTIHTPPINHLKSNTKLTSIIGVDMAPATGFSYQRLRNEGGADRNDYVEEMKRVIDQMKSRIRLSSRLKKVHMRKRSRMKIPSLRKFMKMRARVVMLSMAKVVKRLKDSQSHFGDLFAGNYLFMQVNPSSLKSNSPYAIRGSIKGIEDDLRRSPPRVS